MLLHTVAIVWWCFLFRRVNRYVWLCILAGMCLIVLHCAGYFTDSLLLSQTTALSNSLLTLFAVITTWRSLRRLEAERKAYEEKLAAKTGVAIEIAKVLNAYRTELDYYEKMAKDHGLDPFKK